MIRINLLPRVPRRRLPGRQFIEIGLPLLTLALIIVMGALIYSQNSALERDIAAANKEIADLQPTVARVLELDRQISVLREKEKVILDLIGQQLPAASVLNEIRLLIPKDVWVTSMNVPEPSALTIEGLALNYHAVAQLMDNLAAGQLFRVVDLTLAQVDRVGVREVVRYNVTARILKPQAQGGTR
ncbi:MAG: PilN domain-containing protein [Armatimonadota bacterium]